MNLGYIYIMKDGDTNNYKIGMTTHTPQKRLKELNSDTSRYTPLTLVGYTVVENHEQVEKRLHKDLADYRINPNREFFTLEATQLNWVISELQALTIHDEYLPYNTRVEHDDRDIAIVNDRFGLTLTSKILDNHPHPPTLKRYADGDIDYYLYLVLSAKELIIAYSIQYNISPNDSLIEINKFLNKG